MLEVRMRKGNLVANDKLLKIKVQSFFEMADISTMTKFRAE
jgi:hypothetical protein